MRHSSILTNHAAISAIALGALVVLAACSTPGTSPSSLGQRVSSASTSGFTIYKVNYPSTHPNRITGIASNKEIVGVYGDGTSSIYHSYIVAYTPTGSNAYTQFTSDDYPDAPGGTYMSSIMLPPNANKTVEAGYVTTPGGYNGNLNGNWGVIDNKGIWTLIQKHPNAQKCHMMELFGIDTLYNAVGFYWNPTGTSDRCDASHPYKQVATEVEDGETFKDFGDAPGYNPVATGIYESGTTVWIVGYSNVSSTSSQYEGWIRKSGNYTVFTYNNTAGLSTEAFGLNSSGDVVGTYQDGNNHNWHGFIWHTAFASSPGTVTKIDQGDNTNTVVSGINDSGDICGWYHGNDGHLDGFVGVL